MIISKQDLRFTFNSIAEFDDKAKQGESFFDIVSKMSNSSDGSFPIKLTTIRLLIWAGLLHQNNDLTVAEVGDLIEEFTTEKSFDELFTILGESLIESSFFAGNKSKNAKSGKAKTDPEALPQENS